MQSSVMTYNGVLSPTVEVSGAVVTSIQKGFGAFRPIADKILAEEGFTTIEPGSWYPAHRFLGAFEKIRAKVGSRTAYQIGLRIPESANLPPQIDSAHRALASIDIGYHMNHRGGEIGVYEYIPRGDRSADIRCQNPYPCPFDEGLITAFAIRFEPRTRVVHDPEKCRERGGSQCVYHVSW